MRLIILRCALVGALIGGCSGSSSDELTIGIVMPGNQPFNASDAMLLAVREVNAAGGIDERRVVVPTQFNGGNTTLARSAVERFLDRGAVAIVGLGYSYEAEAVVDLLSAARVPGISYSASSPLLTGTGAPLDFFFRTYPSDVLQARILVDRALGSWACLRAAIVAPMDIYGQSLATELTRGYEAGGRTVVAREDIDSQAADYRPALDRIDAANPDCIVLLTFAAAGGRVIRQWNEDQTRPDVRFIGADAMYDPAIATEVVDTALIDGLVGTSPAATFSTPEWVAFRDRYRASYDRDPIPPEAQMYDAMAIVLLALAGTGGESGPALGAELLEASRPPGTAIGPGDLAQGLSILASGGDINYLGASGPVDFDEAGDVLADYVIWRYDASLARLVVDEVVLAEDIPPIAP